MKAATPDGLGAHAVILLAVSEKPFQQATEYVRSRGTIVAIGLPPDAYLKASVFNTVVRMINIKGSYVGNRQDGVEALDFFARGLIKAPFKLAPLKDLPKIFELMGSTLSTFAFDMIADRKQNKARLLAAMWLRCLSEQRINWSSTIDVRMEVLMYLDVDFDEVNACPLPIEILKLIEHRSLL